VRIKIVHGFVVFGDYSVTIVVDIQVDLADVDEDVGGFGAAGAIGVVDGVVGDVFVADGVVESVVAVEAGIGV
jgi:hypothetical protein